MLKNSDWKVPHVFAVVEVLVGAWLKCIYISVWKTWRVPATLKMASFCSGSSGSVLASHIPAQRQKLSPFPVSILDILNNGIRLRRSSHLCECWTSRPLPWSPRCLKKGFSAATCAQSRSQQANMNPPAVLWICWPTGALSRDEGLCHTRPRVVWLNSPRASHLSCVCVFACWAASCRPCRRCCLSSCCTPAAHTRQEENSRHSGSLPSTFWGRACFCRGGIALRRAGMRVKSMCVLRDLGSCQPENHQSLQKSTLDHLQQTGGDKT